MSEKKRQTNFSEAEKSLVIDFVKKYAHVLENKSAGSQFVKEKQDTWRKCEELFRSQGYQRSWKTLRDLYFRLKLQAKSKINKYKKSLGATEELEEGPEVTSPTEIDWRIYSIVSQDFEKDTNTFDSDSEMIFNAPVVKQEETDHEISLHGPMTALEEEKLNIEEEERALRVELLEKQIEKEKLQISNLKEKHDLEKELLQLQIKKLRES